jgi:hypothetical protein
MAQKGECWSCKTELDKMMRVTFSSALMSVGLYGFQVRSGVMLMEW